MPAIGEAVEKIRIFDDSSPWIKSRFGQASAGSNFACERLQGADNRI